MKKILIMAFILSLILTGCGKSNENVQNSSTPLTTDSPSTQATESPSETPIDSVKEEPTINIGDVFQLKDWEVTLKSFEFNQKVTDNMMSVSADEGSKYLILKLAVTNNGTSANHFIEMIGGTSIKAIYNNKYEYKMSITLLDGDLTNKSIQPLSTASGFAIIEIPDRVVDDTGNLIVRFALDEDKTEIKIR